MELLKVIDEYLKIQNGNFPGNNEYWQKKFEDAYNADKATKDSKPLDDYITKLDNLINGLRGHWVSKDILKQVSIDLKGLRDL